LDSALYGTLHFLGAFPAKTNMSVSIANNDVSLKAGALSGLCLLLYGLNIDYFFLKLFSREEEIDNFRLFDWDGESEYVV
jgi:hypothetical protein